MRKTFIKQLAKFSSRSTSFSAQWHIPCKHCLYVCLYNPDRRRIINIWLNWKAFETRAFGMIIVAKATEEEEQRRRRWWGMQHIIINDRTFSLLSVSLALSNGAVENRFGGTILFNATQHSFLHVVYNFLLLSGSSLIHTQAKRKTLSKFAMKK